MTDHVKIAFPLERDADGYPPESVETLWGVPVGGDKYRIDNIPFFVKGISAEDVIIAKRKDGELQFVSLNKPGGHSTVRILCWNERDVNPLRESLQAIGCSSELSNIRGLVAVDVPPAVEYAKVRSYLL